MKLKKLIITFSYYPPLSGMHRHNPPKLLPTAVFGKPMVRHKNSIAALMKADSVGCYGSEFDVWLTDDDQLVVNWSSVFKGVNMQESTVKECTAIVLDNGEHLPTLQEYLEKARNLKTRLILELKAHKTREQETRAVKKILKMVKGMELEDRMEYITFTSCCQRIYSPCPKGTPVYYQEGDLSPKELKEWGCTGPNYRLNVFRQHPEWIKECHDLGMKVNAFPIDNTDDIKWLISQGIDYITTNEPVKLQEIIREKQ